jgi:chemotaxis signal transduction protein
MIEKSLQDSTREAEFVAFRAGGLEFCINIMSVREIRGWTPATAIPRAPSYNGTMKLDDAVRGLVNFKRLNLMGAWPMRGPFDAVFCRNVLIYFDEKTQTRLLNRVTSLLRPGGFLYLGHSERLVGPAEAMFKADGTTSYRKFGGEEQ